LSDVQVENRRHRLAPEVGDGARSHPTGREHRTAATTAGVLYIVGTVAGILSKAITYFPVHDADDPLAYAADHSDAVATGALLVLVMGLSLAFVPVVLFPVLRRVDEVLATGYRIIRGAVETAIYVTSRSPCCCSCRWARPCRQGQGRTHQLACAWAPS
jgi:hypothetical protein